MYLDWFDLIWFGHTFNVPELIWFDLSTILMYLDWFDLIWFGHIFNVPELIWFDLIWSHFIMYLNWIYLILFGLVCALIWFEKKWFMGIIYVGAYRLHRLNIWSNIKKKHDICLNTINYIINMPYSWCIFPIHSVTCLYLIWCQMESFIQIWLYSRLYNTYSETLNK